MIHGQSSESALGQVFLFLSFKQILHRHKINHVMFTTSGASEIITLASASTMEADLRKDNGDKTAKSKAVGALIASRAKAAGVTTVVFDRAGNKYHGRIAALADSARENGLEF